MKGKFLIVDDDQAIREKFKEILEDMDLEADFVSTYEDVIPTLKKAPHSYAGLFLDHNLKNKDGKSVESLSLVPTISALVDYDLGKDSKNGVDIIKENNLFDKAYLLTANYDEETLIKLCEQLNIKLLPKNLVNFLYES